MSTPNQEQVSTGRLTQTGPYRPVDLGVHGAIVLWSEMVSVGDPLLDSQHKALFEAVNTLYGMRGQEVPDAEIERTVNALGATLRRHFADEEAFLARQNYPDLAIHGAEHARLLWEFDLLKENLGAQTGWGRKSDASWPVLQFMLDVTVGHILKSDLEFRDALKATANPG